MQDAPDAQLLREYAESGDEAAFRELVARHTDLVYSAALRQVTEADLAQDISQSVFVDLARKAKEVGKRLAPDASLVGWLYRSTRFAVLNHLRNNRRRVMHERQAMEQLITDSSPAPDWERIRPLLDEAMAGLNDDDRDALLLRYFKNHDFHTVGRALSLSDDAAQKRVSRAVERLREFFSKRGVAIGASGLVILISANAVQSAPAALAGTISTAGILGGATASTVIATKAIAMTLIQKTLVTATVTVLVGAGVYETHRATQLRQQVETLQEQQAPLTAQLQQLQQQRDEASNQVASLTDEVAKANHNDLELLKLRGEVGALRQQLSQAPRTSQATKSDVAEKPAAPDLAGQIAMDIAHGDPTAVQRLNDFAKAQTEFYGTNSVGLQGDELAAVWTKAFGGIMAAFNSLADEAGQGNPNARQAIDRAVHMEYLQGGAVTSLGKLAGNGDENALQMLLNPEKNGFLISSAIGALGPAAANGNPKAIAALAAVLTDESKKPLWLMASSGLQKAAANGNPVATAALKSYRDQQ